jgi:hypothetical protein
VLLLRHDGRNPDLLQRLLSLLSCRMKLYVRGKQRTLLTGQGVFRFHRRRLTRQLEVGFFFPPDAQNS